MKLVVVSVPLLLALTCAGAAAARTAELAEPSATPTDDTTSATAPQKKEGHQRVQVGLLTGLSVPRPLSIEMMIKVERVFALGFEYSALPSSTLGGATVAYHAYAADARIFPFAGGPFFFGARIGKQHLDGHASATVAPYGTFTGTTNADAWFVNPRMGLLWTSRSGLSVGLDVGLQIPLSHTSTTTLPDGVQAPASISRTIDVLGGASVIPTVTILQVGALF